MYLVFYRYIESMVHFASIRHPAAILDDLHGKVLSEAYLISKSTVTESVSTNIHKLMQRTAPCFADNSYLNVDYEMILN